jgi:ABC-type oligopeptide transport system substrate-binding subunit
MLGEPASLDPAAQGDIGSAAVGAQLYEGLTAFDPSLHVQPALAESWQVLDGGRRIVFRLRDGVTFSDGTPITAGDVFRSWLRVVDPAHPSPLASLMGDVENATAYLRGDVRDPGAVGLRADGRDVEVRLNRPAADFPSIVAAPTFAVVPPSVRGEADAARAGDAFVGSGAYRLESAAPDRTVLVANDRYWAGRPAIGRIELVHDIGGRGPVAAFEAGDVDVAPVAGVEASWIVYDDALGPQLHIEPSIGVVYYGFTTTRPPFDDARVRRAFAMAVDWRRIVPLVGGDDTTTATGMVPPGIPARSTSDFLPPYDPGRARDLLAEAGYPGGAGFPSVSFLTDGSAFDGAMLEGIRHELGIDLKVERMGDGYFERLAAAPPDLWSLSWVTDYPAPNDFLGILLGTGATNNYGRWTSPDFDAAVSDAQAASDAAAARRAWDRAESIVRDDVPVIPVAYGDGWTLVRNGLLGAGENGIGIIRMAGLAWAD